MRKLMAMLAGLCAVFLGAPVHMPAYAQTEANPLVGSWKFVSFQQKLVKDGSVIFPQGPNPQGRLIYAANGRYTTMSTASDRQVAGPDMTDAERLVLFKTMFAFSGRYRVEGDKTHTEIDFAWRADWVGRKTTTTFKVEGSKLTLTSSPFRNVRGEEVVATTVYERE